MHVLQVPLQKTFWMSTEAYTTAGQIFVAIRTADGLTGYGQAHGNPLDEIAQVVREDLAPIVLGGSAWNVRDLWQQMFEMTYRRTKAVTTGQPHFGNRGRYQTMAAIAAVDIALWDLRAKAADLPLHRLLGTERSTVPAYASGGYYPSSERDALGIDGLLEEMGTYVDGGFDTAKMKVGRDPDNDIRRVAAVREHFPDLRLLVDANGAWTFTEAARAAAGFADYGVAWLEEPLAWFANATDLGRLAEVSPVPLAGGEQEPHKWACVPMLDQGNLRYLQLDCTRAGGITEWLDAAAFAVQRNVGLAPHHDPQIHSHLLAAYGDDVIQETFPDPVRDPLWDLFFLRRPTLENGMVQLPAAPGLGFEPDPKMLRRWSVASWTCTGTRADVSVRQGSVSTAAAG
ncbi:MAG: mandelate racemase/muconate lactonizing enzyme family protein [Mycobacteriales bacterium]